MGLAGAMGLERIMPATEPVGHVLFTTTLRNRMQWHPSFDHPNQATKNNKRYRIRRPSTCLLRNDEDAR
jgi:chorismate-pyruvate lyase